jgi:hypothetical protein
VGTTRQYQTFAAPQSLNFRIHLNNKTPQNQWKNCRIPASARKSVVLQGTTQTALACRQQPSNPTYQP